MTDKNSIDIPAGVLVACPQARFALVRVGNQCPACPSFDGLSDRFPGGPQAFEQRYAVRCRAEPVQRTLARMEGV